MVLMGMKATAPKSVMSLGGPFRTGRRVYWDLAAGRFAGDDEASAG